MDRGRFGRVRPAKSPSSILPALACRGASAARCRRQNDVRVPRAALGVRSCSARANASATAASNSRPKSAALDGVYASAVTAVIVSSSALCTAGSNMRNLSITARPPPSEFSCPPRLSRS
jgi:hypothetical protein